MFSNLRIIFRDTTVQTLTMQTVVENGIIRHEDSALVKAARSGQVSIKSTDPKNLLIRALTANLIN